MNLDTATSYTYDSSKHWLNGIQRVGSTKEKANFAYDATDGRLTKITYGNGARSEYGFDASAALTKIAHYGSSGTLMASIAYAYDPAGNVTTATLSDALTYKGDAVVTYQYDDVYRLTREDCQPAQGSYRQAYRYGYAYDAVGNRTKMTYFDGATTATTTYAHSPRNELTQMVCEGTTTSLLYDLRGNLTKKGTGEYYWDSQDHLTKVVNGGTSAQYKYNAFGRRVAKKVNDNDWKWFFYDGLQVVAEGSSTTSRLSYTNSPSVVGGIITRGDGATTYTYHFDRLGNVMAITDTSGNPYAVYTMEAFGNVLEKGTSSGYSSEHQTDPQPYHLTTKEYDSDISLYYFNARWYDPDTGRFLARSPARVIFEHPYAFCENSPTYFVDSEGLLRERNKPECRCTEEAIKKQKDAIRKRLERVKEILGACRRTPRKKAWHENSIFDTYDIVQVEKVKEIEEPTEDADEPVDTIPAV